MFCHLSQWQAAKFHRQAHEHLRRRVCPVNPAVGKPGTAWTSQRWYVPVNVVHSGYMGLFVHVQISLSRSDVSQMR